MKILANRLWALSLLVGSSSPSVVQANPLEAAVGGTLADLLDRAGIPDAEVELNVRIVIPAGSHPYAAEDRTLWATAILPSNAGFEQVPTVLVATAYRRELCQYLYVNLVRHGYALVSVDVPGTGSSEGSWLALGLSEQYQVKYLVDSWIPAQEWSDGKVAMIGSSYMAHLQLLTAGLVDTDPMTGEPLHLKAIFPILPGSDGYKEISMPGGTPGLMFPTFWATFTEVFGVLPPLTLLGERGELSPDHIVESVPTLTDHIRDFPRSYDLALFDPDLSLESSWYHQKSPFIYWPVKPEGGWGFPEGENVVSPHLPVFLLAGWFDLFTSGTLNDYSYGLSQHAVEDKALVIADWYHLSGAFGFRLPSVRQMDVAARWFDWKVKGIEDSFMKEFPVVLYVMGEDRWRAEKSWPLPPSRLQARSLYLSSKASAPLDGDWFTHFPGQSCYSLVEHPEDVSQPEDGLTLRHSASPWNLRGTLSRSPVRWSAGALAVPGELLNELSEVPQPLRIGEDERADELGSLIFSTPELEEDLEIIGPLTLSFWASTEFDQSWGSRIVRASTTWLEKTFSTARNRLVEFMNDKDVQWVVELNDVFPDGRARNITSGWLRGSRRPSDPDEPPGATVHEIDPAYEPFDPFYNRPSVEPRDLRPGDLYHFVIELWPTCNVFKAGHRIRISLSTSDFPHLLPILTPSTNHILLDSDHPARLDFNTTTTSDEGHTWKWIDDVDQYLRTHSDP